MIIIIMWARVCIILHNLIIRIEGNDFNQEWRDGLMQSGLDGEHGFPNADEEDEPGNVLEWARQWLETPGQRFQLKLMNNLFSSNFHTIECHP